MHGCGFVICHVCSAIAINLSNGGIRFGAGVTLTLATTATAATNTGVVDGGGFAGALVVAAPSGAGTGSVVTNHFINSASLRISGGGATTAWNPVAGWNAPITINGPCTLIQDVTLSTITFQAGSLTTVNRAFTVIGTLNVNVNFSLSTGYVSPTSFPPPLFLLCELFDWTGPFLLAVLCGCGCAVPSR
jgi:hypothetical protein